VIIWIIPKGNSLAGNFSENDLVGTWRVDPSTYVASADMGIVSGVMRIVQKDGTELMWHNGSFVAKLPELMPTNFTAFALDLNKDGMFVATNLPAGFFFDLPIIEAAGTWTLNTNRVKALLSDNMSEYQDLWLHFTKPSTSPRTSQMLIFPRKSLPQQPLLHIIAGIYRQVDLIKEQACGLTDAAPNFVPEHNIDGEPNGAVNASQPARSETNRTSSAVGSRR
jgi:hypothetical protein